MSIPGATTFARIDSRDHVTTPVMGTAEIALTITSAEEIVQSPTNINVANIY